MSYDRHTRIITNPTVKERVALCKLASEFAEHVQYFIVTANHAEIVVNEKKLDMYACDDAWDAIRAELEIP
jgi:hypothetical protein